VNDKAIQQLMVSYCKNWFGSEAVVAERQTASGVESGLTKGTYRRHHQTLCFLKTRKRKELKAKFPDPLLQGSF